MENPATLMSQLNQVMLENSPPNKYITVFYGELDPQEHVFEYVNAGHNPPVFCHKNEYLFLPAGGPVVGIVQGAKYQAKAVSFDPRDLLFMYTDGISESQNPDEQEFGEEGVVQFLKKNPESTVEDLSNMLEQHIREFTKGAPPLDDSTLIFLRRMQ